MNSLINSSKVTLWLRTKHLSLYGDNMISSIKIKGFRGFSEEQKLELAKPDNENIGSGLTVIVGPNNGGKSTIIESFKLMSSGNDISFAEGQRNKKAGGIVEIVLSSYDEGPTHSLKSISAGSHKAKRTPELQSRKTPEPSINVLSSRRFFNPYSNEASRGDGILIAARPELITLKARGQPIDTESNQLFKIIENPKSSEEFNKLLKHMLGYELKWTVDLCNTGEYYIKINDNHDSDGLGEGLVSLLFLVEALLNSSPDKLLVIDEPELSLHPQLQRNLLEIILEKSKNSQIVCATHSPEMVSIDAIINGGTLAKVVNPGDGSKIYQLNEESRDCLGKFEGDLFNPHVLGYDARSCFFEDDKLVVVEGQEDVTFLRKALTDLGINKRIRFFGFGAGGADKIKFIITILESLGFEKVCCLYDGDKETEKTTVEGKFPRYHFEILNAKDIRDKECRYYKNCENIRAGNECKICHMNEGIFNKEYKIKDEYKDEFESLLNRIGNLWIEE